MQYHLPTLEIKLRSVEFREKNYKMCSICSLLLTAYLWEKALACEHGLYVAALFTSTGAFRPHHDHHSVLWPI